MGENKNVWSQKDIDDFRRIRMEAENQRDKLKSISQDLDDTCRTEGPGDPSDFGSPAGKKRMADNCAEAMHSLALLMNALLKDAEE